MCTYPVSRPPDCAATVVTEKALLQLAAIAASCEDAIIGGDLDGVIEIWNPSAERLFGYSAEEVKGRSVSLLFHPDCPNELPYILERLRRGEHIGPAETVRVRKDGRLVPVSVSISSLKDTAGRVIGVVAIDRDIGHLKRAEEGLRQKTAILELLHAVTVAANEASTVAEALQTALNRVCAHTGWPLGHAYNLAVDGGRELVPTGIWHLEKPERFAPFRQATEATRFGPGAGLLGQVLVSGRPGWITDVTQAPNFLRAESARTVGIRSAFAFPVLVGVEVVAVLEFFSTDTVALDEPLLEVMGQIGTQLGRVIERDRRHRAEDQVRATVEEFRLARQIHRKLFPQSAPALPGYDIAAVSHAAQATGGDYYDYIPLPGEAVGIVVGDVSGHGFGPALMMSQARAYLRALALMHAEVGDLLTRANQILTEDTEEGRFITLFFARLDPRTRNLVYAGAGHDGYLLPASGGVARLPSTGLPLGVMGDAVIPCGSEVPLRSGDLIFCCTDGIPETEGADGTQFGIGRALELVHAHRRKTACAIIDTLYRAVEDFAQHRPQRDDITAVVIKVEV